MVNLFRDCCQKSLPVRTAFADREKNRKRLVSGGGSGGGGGGSKGEVAGVVVVLMTVVLVNPPTLYKPSATVLFHFVSKLIFS